MKSTGIIRRIDELGRLVIPKEIRRVYGLALVLIYTLTAIWLFWRNTKKRVPFVTSIKKSFTILRA